MSIVCKYISKMYKYVVRTVLNLPNKGDRRILFVGNVLSNTYGEFFYFLKELFSKAIEEVRVALFH